MLIKIKTLDNDFITAKLSFDTYGNLYFDVDNICYQINIDGYNNPYAEKGIYDIVSDKPTPDIFNEIKLLRSSNSLKNKTLDEYCVIDQYQEEINYFPERDEYIQINTVDSDEIIDEIIDDDNISKYGCHNIQFNFSCVSNSLSIPIHQRKNGDISALYDAYIYNKGLICTKSNSKCDESIYTLKIHDNGTVYFRPHGDKESQYFLSMSSVDDIIFNKVL